MPQLRVLLNFTRGAADVPLMRALAVKAGLYHSDHWLVPPNPAPPVSETDLGDAIDSYRHAIGAASNGSTEDTARKAAQRKALEGVLRQLAHYVQANHGNDLTKLVASGFEAASTSNAQSPLETPGITAIVNNASSQLTLRVTAIDNARGYEVRRALVAEDGTLGDWEGAGFFTNTRGMVVTGLTPGKVYQFQVRALGGSTGASDWSDAVQHRSL
jgi:hypothetical protein